MQYEFEAPDGSLVLLTYPIGRAPRIGDTVKWRGETLRRLPPRPQLDVRKEADKPWKCWQLHPGEAKALGHRHFDDLGNPVFTTRGERSAFQTAYNKKKEAEGSGERLEWDP